MPLEGPQVTGEATLDALHQECWSKILPVPEKVQSDRLLARIIHKPRREVPEMSVTARKSSEPTGGVSLGYAEDRR